MKVRAMKIVTPFLMVSLAAFTLGCGGGGDEGMDEGMEEMAPDTGMAPPDTGAMSIDTMGTNPMEQGMPDEMMPDTSGPRPGSE